MQAELDDVQEQLRKEEETRGELEDNIKGLRQEMEVSRTELALAKVNIGVAGAAGGAAVSSAVDSARLAELESLLDARTRELADMGDKWVPDSRGGGGGRVVGFRPRGTQTYSGATVSGAPRDTRVVSEHHHRTLLQGLRSREAGHACPEGEGADREEDAAHREGQGAGGDGAA